MMIADDGQILSTTLVHAAHGPRELSSVDHGPPPRPIAHFHHCLDLDTTGTCIVCIVQL